MRAYLNKVTFFFRYAWVFSLFINISLLLSPLYMLQIYDRVLTSRSLPTLVMLSIGMLIALIIYTVLEALRSRILVQAGLALDSLLSPQVLNEAFSKQSNNSNKQNSTPTRDVAVVRQYLTGNGIFAFFDAPWAIVFLAIIFIMHWMLGVTALAGMLILLGLAILDERKTRHLLLEANIVARQSSQYIESALRNKEAITSMGMRQAVINRWQLINEKVLYAQATASDKSGLFLASTKGIRTLLQSLMLGIGAYLVISENLSSGIMIAATILLGKATAPIELAISGWKGFIDARASYHRLNSMLANESKQDKTVHLPTPVGKISAERIVFKASEDNPPIIKGISFQLNAGESLAIIGPSAAGKSTLLKLLLGIWQVQAGEVRIDGANIKDWSDLTLGQHLGYLPQEIALLGGTVAENIARMQDASSNSEAIIEAAKLAGAHDMILKLPKGYDTELGENGAALSGGQRQRIGLARALFKTPKIIVLDEPNSNLDNDGEVALIEAIKQLKTLNSTVIYVTHKPSLVNYADKLMILDSGNIVAFDDRDIVLAQMQANQTKNNAVQSIKPNQKAV